MRKGVWVVGVVLLAAGVAAGWVSYERRVAEYFCVLSYQAPTVAARRDAWAEAEPAWRRTRSFGPEPACDRADAERRRLGSPECPFYPPLDASCRCGEKKWPDDWHQPVLAKCADGARLEAEPDRPGPRWIFPWKP